MVTHYLLSKNKIILSVILNDWVFWCNNGPIFMYYHFYYFFLCISNLIVHQPKMLSTHRTTQSITAQSGNMVDTRLWIFRDSLHTAHTNPITQLACKNFYFLLQSFYFKHKTHFVVSTFINSELTERLYLIKLILYILTSSRQCSKVWSMSLWTIRHNAIPSGP